MALVNVIVLISAYESFHCLIQVCPREVKMADHIIDQRIRTYFNQGLTQAEIALCLSVRDGFQISPRVLSRYHEKTKGKKYLVITRKRSLLYRDNEIISRYHEITVHKKINNRWPFSASVDHACNLDNKPMIGLICV